MKRFGRCRRTKKIRYRSKGQAKHFAKLFSPRFAKTYRPYVCPYCRSIHLTTEVEMLGGMTAG